MFAFLSVFLQFRFKCFILMCFLLHFSSCVVCHFLWFMFSIFSCCCLASKMQNWNMELVLRMFQTTTRDLFILFLEQCHYDADADAFQFVSLLKLFDLCKCVCLFVSPFVRILFVFVFLASHAAFFYFSICLFLFFLRSLQNIQTLKCEIKREIIVVVAAAAASTGMQNTQLHRKWTRVYE